MPPHGNLTNMGLTEPEVERQKLRIIKCERQTEKEGVKGYQVKR